MGMFRKIVEEDERPDHSKGISTMDQFESDAKTMQATGNQGPLVVSEDLFKMFKVDPKAEKFTYGSPGIMVEKFKG